MADREIPLRRAVRRPISGGTARPGFGRAFFMNYRMGFASLGLLIALTATGVWAQERAIVDDFDERPVPVKAFPPAYPPEMLRQGITGLVSVTVVIDEKGAVVESVVAKSTRSEFERPALEAVRKWKFRPGMKGGAPVTVRMVLPVQFSLKE